MADRKKLYLYARQNIQVRPAAHIIQSSKSWHDIHSAVSEAFRSHLMNQKSKTCAVFDMSRFNLRSASSPGFQSESDWAQSLCHRSTSFNFWHWQDNKMLGPNHAKPHHRHCGPDPMGPNILVELRLCGLEGEPTATVCVEERKW